MPPKRRTYRKRKPVKGKKLTRYEKKEVVSLINKNIETKIFNFQINAFAVSNLGVLGIGATSIPQGISEFQRIGDDIKLMRIDFRVQWSPTLPVTAANDFYNVCRMIVFQWCDQDTILLPVVADILDLGPSGFIDVNSFYNHNQRKSYRILYDRKVTLAIPATDPAATVSFKGSVKPKRHDVQYQNALVTGVNRIYYLAISDSGAVAHPLFSLNSRVHYKDA